MVMLPTLIVSQPLGSASFRKTSAALTESLVRVMVVVSVHPSSSHWMAASTVIGMAQSLPLTGPGRWRRQWRMEPIVKRVGMSATMAALLGTALGIAGSIVTTAVGAHYTSTEHMADRAEARAKERREALTNTYAGAIALLKERVFRVSIYVNEQMELAKPPAPEVIEKRPPDPKQEKQDELVNLLELTGSKEAVAAYDDAFLKLHQILDKPLGAERQKAIEVVDDAIEHFSEAARKDIQSDRF